MKSRNALFLLFLCTLVLFGGSEKAANAKRNMSLQRNQRDILGADFGAVLIPSSQDRDDLKACVEQCVDGKLSTVYRSLPGVFPAWIEARWPQNAAVDGARIYFRDSSTVPEYVTFMARGLNGNWQTLRHLTGEEVNAGFVQLPETDCTALKMIFGPTRCGRLEVREIEVTGAAPRSILPQPTWQGKYIWYPDENVDNVTRYFRRSFNIPAASEVISASMQIAADDTWQGWCNGREFGRGGVAAKSFDLLPFLQDGKNVLAFQVNEFSIDEGLLVEFTLRYRDGHSASIITDGQWRVCRETGIDWQLPAYDDSSWIAAKANKRSKNGVRFQPEIRLPDNIVWEKCQIPSQVRPGEKVTAKLTFKCTGVSRENWGFRVTLGEKPLVTVADFRLAEKELFPTPATPEWEPGKSYEIQAELYIPTWAPDGKVPLTVTAVSGTAQDTMPSPQKNEITIKRFDQPIHYSGKLAQAEVRMVGEGPKLFVNGKAVAPYVFYDNAFNSLRVSGAHSTSGAPIHRIKLADHNFFAATPEERQAKMKFVLEALDQKMEMFIRQRPDAWILLGVIPCPGYDWNATFPNELTQLPDGRKFNHSFSSQKYLEETLDGIRQIIANVKASKYASRIIGFNLQLGDGPETYYWGAANNRAGTPREKLQMGDVSPAAVNAFRQWLKDKYNNDTAALKKAWKMPDVDFDNATPDVNEFRRQDTTVFRDPAKGRMAMDFWEFQSDAVAHVVTSIAKTVKEATEDRWLCGVMGFYNTNVNHCTGYLGRGQQIGYTSVMKVMDSPWLDYMAAIQGYAAVNDGTPVISLLTLDSLRRRGKLFLEEYDCRTFMTDLTFSVVGHHYSEHETRRILTRNFGKSLAHDHAYWWNAHTLGGGGRRSVGWYDDDGILEFLRYSGAVQQESTAYPFASAAEVGVFFNNRDIVSMDPIHGDPVLASARFNFVVNQLSNLGIPFELNTLEDLTPNVISQYKVIVVADAFYLDAARRKEIRKLLDQAGKSVIWLYAPGYVDKNNGLDVRNTEALTGFALDVNNTPVAHLDLKVTLTGGDSLTKGIEGISITPSTYLYDRRKLTLGPVFTVKQGEGQPLGSFNDGKTAIAVKRHKRGGMDVYCAIPDFPASLLKAICRESGVHIYTDSPVYLETSKRYLSLHATAAGLQGELHLPEPRCLLDLFSLEMVAGNAVRSFKPSLAPFESKVYFMGTRQEVLDMAEKLRQRTGGPLAPLPKAENFNGKALAEIPCIPTDEAILNPVEAAEWTGAISKMTETTEGTPDEYILQVQGRAFLFSAQTLPIDPKKSYRLSGFFRTVPGTKPSTIYFGVQPYDANGQVISPTEVHAIEGSETVLLEDTQAGSYTLKVKKNPAWKQGADRCIAFNVDTSGNYNDLPNRTVTKPGVALLKEAGNAMLITLTHPLKANWTAGTPVRQHGISASYIYCGAINQAVPEEWQEIGGIISGESKSRISHARHWWRGTRYARIVLLMNYSGNNSNAAFMQEISLEEVKPGEENKKKRKPSPIKQADAQAETSDKKAVLQPAGIKDWTGAVAKMSEVTDGTAEVGTMRVNGRAYLYSSERLPIDPRKTYRLAGEFCAVPGTRPSTLYFGVQPYDANGEVISPTEVHTIEGSETVLLEDAKAGSKTIVVKKNSKWKAGNDRRIAFKVDTTGNYNDLPNRTVTKAGVKSLQENGDSVLVTLEQPLTATWPAGTPIRQHGISASYIYCAAINQAIPGEWQEISGPIAAESRSRITHARHWWKGTRSARIVLLMNFAGKPGDASFMRNIRLEEVKK